jgi:hypothetical protein
LHVGARTGADAIRKLNENKKQQLAMLSMLSKTPPGPIVSGKAKLQMVTRKTETQRRWFRSLAALGLFLFAILNPVDVLADERSFAMPPLPHEAYVWQRAWNEPVREAVAQHSPRFRQLVLLNAEVSWRNGAPHVIRVPLDFAALRKVDRPIGLALRIGPFSGPFAADNYIANFLAELAASLVAQAQTNDVSVSELQLDFDCADSKLDGYRVWVEAIQRKLAPTPVTITALPSWLNQPAFPRLARVATNYVLQVHSLERPRSYDAPFTLCEPAAARRAVERASRIGVPFRVALPTYGYLLAFSREGKFIGLSAEGPAKDWPADARVREVRADPLALAELVQSWSANRPESLRGFIWYRLPVPVDNLNWRWPTLRAILDSRSSRESLRAEPRRVEAGLVEINLVNDGELDISSRLAIEVRWQNARLVAGDALGGFELVDGGTSTAKFQTASKPVRLPAGEMQVIGWLRLSEEREVTIEIKKM